MHKFILVGITGKIASGKSLVMKYFEDKGYKTFSADEVVHNLYTKPEVQDKLIKLLPELKSTSFMDLIESFLIPFFITPKNASSIDFGPINKNKLAKIIFKNPQKRKLLEDLIHPMVTKELKEFTKNLSENEIGFAEIPLLFEAKMENLFDYVIVTYCDKSIRFKRALTRGTSQSNFEKIDQIQLDDEIKIRLANFAINSNVDKETLVQNIDDIIGKIK